jgi:hypothetical protein
MYFLDVFFSSYDTRCKSSVASSLQLEESSLDLADWMIGNGVGVWMTMVLEMNIGIICGCLSGVKPVLATVFPVLFGTSHRSRSGAMRPTYSIPTSRSIHGESFAFQPLSDAPSNTKSQSKTVDHEFSVKAIQDPNYKKQRNFAWASSNGNMEADPSIPKNAIGINQVVLVEEEEAGSGTPGSEVQNKLSDAGSEEWIMDDEHRIQKP